MKPLDPRLLREAGAARRYLVTTVGFGLVTTALVLVQAGLLAHVIAHAHAGAAALRTSLVALAVVVLLRAAAGYGGEVAAPRAAATVKSQLRRKLAARIAALGPAWVGRQHPGELTTLATRGLDALDPYFARYLPQLVLACLVPIAVIGRVAGADLVSAIVIGATLPLIPIFMVLVGLHTRARTERQWLLLARLGGHFLDVVEGLATLKVFGRAKAQADAIRRVTEQHRQATMATLRVAFLSALVLELLATLATAVVAVEVGLRLLNGHLGYETALVVLLLTPEAYLPLRSVGAQFHASMEGVTAAQQALDLLEVQLPETRPSARQVDLTSQPLRFSEVSLRYPDRNTDAVRQVSFEIRPGDHVALQGPSGAGKSSLLALMLGFVEPTAGRISVGDVDVCEVDVTELRRQIAWVPQSPYLFAGTIADNIRFADPTATADEIERAASAAGVLAFAGDWPDRLDTEVGERGLALSSGQRQRVAVARAFLRDAPLVLLDEPTAHLDDETAQELRAAFRHLGRGRTVVVVSHTHGWTGDADRVLRVVDGLVTEEQEALAS